MNLFIDTNIFLSFFHLSKDDLEEINKLAVLLDKNEITLWITKQVIDEFYRNRENKISDAMKKLKEQRLNGQFPQFCKEYEDYRLVRDYEKKYNQHFDLLMSKIYSDITNNNFKADQKIKELFSISSILETCPEIVYRATFRLKIGNPPGKNDSPGDAINWESLLQNIPDKECLYIITDDKDYYSLLDENEIKEFLKNEWEEKKGSNVFIYRRLSRFFKDHFPEINLSEEQEKESAIKLLGNSDNFYEVYNAIELLSEYSSFSKTQAEAILRSSLDNAEVRCLLGNASINKFYSNIISKNYKIIDGDLVEKILHEIDCVELFIRDSSVYHEHDYFKIYKEKIRKISKQYNISKIDDYALLAKQENSMDWFFIQEKIELSLQKLFISYQENYNVFISEGFSFLQSEYFSLLKNDVKKEILKNNIIKNEYV